MTHPFSTDAFSSVREFLYSASWSRRPLSYAQRTRAADRMLAGRSCDHALFADVLDWAAVRQTCREMHRSMPAQPLRANLEWLSSGFVARCFHDLLRRTDDTMDHTRALFYHHIGLGNRDRRHWLLILVVLEDRENEEEAEMDDYRRTLSVWDRLRAPIPEPVTPVLLASLCSRRGLCPQTATTSSSPSSCSQVSSTGSLVMRSRPASSWR